jgi:DNA-binding MarR family transcriptional regulator
MDIDDYLERLCVLLRSTDREAGTRSGLQPVHWQTLRYLAACNRYSDTPAGIVEFLGQTKGSVSQSIKILEEKGLLEKRPDASDRRVVHLRLTDEATRLLLAVGPDQRLRSVTEQLPMPTRAALNEGLKQLLQALQHANGRRSFGLCASCRFNERSDAGYRCGLTGDLLSAHDVTRICREHVDED